MQLKKIVLLLSVLVLGACTQYSKVTRKKDKLIANINNEKVFFYPYDKVWRAAQLSIKYPITISNMDSGELETDAIREAEGFTVPNFNNSPTSSRYKINVRLNKGTYGKKEAIRVIVSKVISKQRDFFSDPVNLESDGLEEKVILYRIERELKIEEAIQRSHEKEESKKSS